MSNVDANQRGEIIGRGAGIINQFNTLSSMSDAVLECTTSQMKAAF